MIRPLLFFLLALLSATPLLAARPVISHEAPASVPQGQDLKIVARVASPNDPVQTVSVHVAQSANAASTEIAMTSAGAGVYYGVLPAALFQGAGSFRYYIDAHTRGGEWSETAWVTVQVAGAAGSGADEEEDSILGPALIVGGVVLVAGVAVAISESDSDDDGGDSSADSGSSTPGEIIRSASDTVNTASLSLPSESTIDASGEIGARKIDRLRIQFTFASADEGAESFQVLYNGSVVISGSTAGAFSETVEVQGSDSAAVTVRILSSVAGAGGSYQYNWNASVTYRLAAAE